MIKIVISTEDIQYIINNPELVEIGKYMILNCKRSKYDYFGNEVTKSFYYVELKEETAKRVLEVILANEFYMENMTDFAIKLTKSVQYGNKNKKVKTDEENNIF